jgi:hypothetical protein
MDLLQLAMHEAWNFNTRTAQKVMAYQNLSSIVQSMRDITPNSGSYIVSVAILCTLKMIYGVYRMRVTCMKSIIHVCTASFPI